MESPTQGERMQLAIASRPVTRITSRIMHHLDRFVFRLSGGRASALSIFMGLPVMNITTIGAKSGQPRTMPLLAIPVEGSADEVAIIASNWGQAHLPGWYYNIRKTPVVTGVMHGQTRQYDARELQGEEYDHIWQRATRLYAGYRSYRARAGRHIPIIQLTPRS